MHYDHRCKAGNLGDLFKHLALLAALDEVIDARAGQDRVLRYADAFAGHACTAVDPGHRPEGFCAHTLLEAPEAELPPPAQWLAVRYGGAHRWARYPGSAMIVRDRCADRGIDVRLSLWDTSAPAVVSLRLAFHPHHAVHERPARSEDDGIASANLLLLDPPGLLPEFQISLVQLGSLMDAARHAAVLVWLPKLREEGGELLAATQWGADRGLCCIDVEWGQRAGHSRLVGCRIFCTPPAPAMGGARRAGVGEVARWLARRLDARCDLVSWALP